jgi:hypothetical protein
LIRVDQRAEETVVEGEEGGEQGEGEAAVVTETKTNEEAKGN